MVGVPSILVPLPTAADNHQASNTRDLEEVGGCITIAQNDFEVVKVKEIVENLFANYEQLRKMSDNAKKAGIKDAAKRFADAIEKEIVKS